MPLLKQKRTRSKLTPEFSDGDGAWKLRYVELYDRYCDLHEDVRILCGLHSLGSHDEAGGMCGAILDRYDQEVRKLVRC
jgi:hypothetical protein